MPRHDAKTDLLQGTLDLLILQVTAAGAVHGYAIAQRLERLSNGAIRVPQGSLYPALHRLEDRGWLRAEWKETITGRDAKFYSLTAAGRRQLVVERKEWNQLSDGIMMILAAAVGS